jgi:4a-hydroxytetrahydrobiopterin dehydratase
MEKLTGEQIEKQISGWKIEEDEIEKVFEFSDFPSAIDFVNKVAKVAEELNHHPDIQIHYNKVEIDLTTHEIGAVSQKDVDVASRIDSI